MAEMFAQTFVEGKTKKTWTVMMAFIGQIILLTVAVILPMIYFDVLPKTTLQTMLIAPPPPPPPPPPPAAPAPVKIVKVIPRQFDAGKLMAPKEVPKKIAEIKEDELPPTATGAAGVVGGVPGGVAGGTPGGVLGGIISSGNVNPTLPPPPPPPVKKEPEKVAPKRITIGGNVQQAKLVRQPKPVYPPLAKQARISGVVHLAAVISANGTIQDLKVISGHPLLIPAALEAVKQWVYQPTLLNGEPVEVQTQIDVNFTLSQ
jgi:protein TonB